MSDVNALNLEPGEIVGGYTLISRLGAGAMGSVWRVHDDGGQVYAMKILRDSLADDSASAQGDPATAKERLTARERLRREAMALKKVNHPGVCGIVDMELDDSLAFIVTELIEGKNLRDDVKANGRYTGDDLERLARKLIEAVKAVHAAGIVHRDIKPTNVMVSASGPVLVDFGIAMTGGESHVTRTGLVMGTPGFIAPEIIEGEESDEATDWWSTASVLAYAATGAPVFGTKPMMAVLERAASGNANLTGMPAGTMAAFRAALNPDRRKRCSPDELLHAIALDALNPFAWQDAATGVSPDGGSATSDDAMGAMRPFEDADPDNPRSLWRNEPIVLDPQIMQSLNAQFLNAGMTPAVDPQTTVLPTAPPAELPTEPSTVTLPATSMLPATSILPSNPASSASPYDYDATSPLENATLPLESQTATLPTDTPNATTVVIPQPPQPPQPPQNPQDLQDLQETMAETALRPAVQRLAGGDDNPTVAGIPPVSPQSETERTTMMRPAETTWQTPPQPPQVTQMAPRIMPHPQPAQPAQPRPMMGLTAGGAAIGAPYANPADIKRARYRSRGVAPVWMSTLPLALLAACMPGGAALMAASLLWLLLTLGYSTESQLKRESRHGGERKRGDGLRRAASLPWHMLKSLGSAALRTLLMIVAMALVTLLMTWILGLPVVDADVTLGGWAVPLPLIGDAPLSAGGATLAVGAASGWILAVFVPNPLIVEIGAGALRGAGPRDADGTGAAAPDDVPRPESGQNRSGLRRSTVLLAFWAVVTFTLCTFLATGNVIDWWPFTAGAL